MKTFKEYYENKEIKEAKLRSVKVTYDDGTVIPTSMSAKLKDKDIYDYFKIGKSFNIGDGEKDKMAKVKKVEILEEIQKYTIDQLQPKRAKIIIDVIKILKDARINTSNYSILEGVLDGENILIIPVDDFSLSKKALNSLMKFSSLKDVGYAHNTLTIRI